MADEMCELPLENATPAEVRELLRSTKVIAVVGLSDKPDRASHGVAAFMQSKGYRIIPVNPALSTVLGEKCYPSLRDVPEKVDMVDVFRRPDVVPAIVEEAIAIGAKSVWMQEGVVHNAAADRARAAGLKVVMDRCLLKEYRKLDRGA